MKHSTPEEDLELGELIGKFYPPEEIEISTDTSTEAGRKWRLVVLRAEDDKNHLANLRRLYRETGDKRYAWHINNITDGADNLPQDDN